MEMPQKNPFIPYEQVGPGFEAVYSGEVSPTALPPEGWPVSRFTDEDGRVILRWSVWPWTSDPANWDAEILQINAMQAALGPLDITARQVRAHVGSLVLCDSGIPVSIDEILAVIGRSGFFEPPFNAGCWPNPAGWEYRGTQPGQAEAFALIERVLRGYLAGDNEEDLLRSNSDAAPFVRRAFSWLPPLSQLTPVQRLLFDRLLLPFDFFTWRDRNDAVLVEDCYGENGRGAALDLEIAQAAGLPRIYANYRPEFHAMLEAISDPARRDLYRICGMLAHGLHTLSDCHHSSLRWVEQWVHDVATLRVGIAERSAGSERARLARLLFGYTLGLDRWLAGEYFQFLLLDLAYTGLGFEVKDEVLRVYALLGEDRAPLKRWLAACLWKILAGAGNPRGLDDPRGLVIQQDLNRRSETLGISPRTWLEKIVPPGGLRPEVCA